MIQLKVDFEGCISDALQHISEYVFSFFSRVSLLVVKQTILRIGIRRESGTTFFVRFTLYLFLVWFTFYLFPNEFSSLNTINHTSSKKLNYFFLNKKVNNVNFRNFSTIGRTKVKVIVIHLFTSQGRAGCSLCLILK